MCLIVDTRFARQIESLQQENSQLRQVAFTFVPPASGLPGTSPSASTPLNLPSTTDIFATALPPAKRAPSNAEYDTGYSSGNVGSPNGSEGTDESDPSTVLQQQPTDDQSALQLADVLKDMDPAAAKELLVNLLEQQAAARQSLLSPTAPVSNPSPPAYSNQAEIDRLIADITGSSTSNTYTEQQQQPTDAVDWTFFDPQVIDLMSVVLPQATDNYDTLLPYLTPGAALPDFSTLPPLAPIGVGIPEVDATAFGGNFANEMEWQVIEPTKMKYGDARGMIRDLKVPELRLPDSAVKILRTLDIDKVPCEMLRGKLKLLKEKVGIFGRGPICKPEC